MDVATRKYRKVLLSLVRFAMPTKKMIHDVAVGGVPFGVEVGAACGETGAMLLAELPRLHMAMVDRWAEFDPKSAYTKSGDRRARLSEADHVNRWKRALEVVEFAGERVELLRMDSLYAAKMLTDRGQIADFVFIDGSHAFSDVKADLAAWWPVVRSGGLFCGHDYGHHKHHGVKKAVDRFFKRKDLVLGVDETSVWWGWKP